MDTPKWDFSKDIIDVYAPTMFPLEIAKKYEICCFCVNTARGIYYQKKRGDFFDIILVNKDGSSKALKNAFVAGSDEQYTCLIVHSVKDKKNYLIDTRGILFSLPELPEIFVLGPMQLDFVFHRDTGTYTIRGDNGKNLWNIKLFSNQAVMQYLSDTAADSSQTLNPSFVELIKQKNNCKYLFFTCRDNKQGKIINWLINHGLPYEVVPNVFEDDDTINIRIEYSEQNKGRIDFQYLSSKYSSSYSINNVPIEHLLSSINISYTERHRYNLLLPTLNITQLKMCDCIINTLKSLLCTDKTIDIYKETLLPLLQQFYIKNEYDANNVFDCIMMSSADPDEIKQNRTKYRAAIQIYEAKLLAEMNLEGISIGKWTQEVELFTLIHKQFPDAIYQYRPSWLGKQSLDVYIPSINTAFEYQGIQHYEPVEFFGGIEGYKRTVERDGRKSEVCKNNGVKIIYWKYDEPVNQIVLRKKLLD